MPLQWRLYRRLPRMQKQCCLYRRRLQMSRPLSGYGMQIPRSVLMMQPQLFRDQPAQFVLLSLSARRFRPAGAVLFFMVRAGPACFIVPPRRADCKPRGAFWGNSLHAWAFSSRPNTQCSKLKTQN